MIQKDFFSETVINGTDLALSGAQNNHKQNIAEAQTKKYNCKK